jgi:hypothetical protein
MLELPDPKEPPEGRASPRRPATATAAGVIVVLVLASLVVARVVAGRIRTLSASDSIRLPGMLTTTAPWPSNTARLGSRLERLGLPPVGSFEHLHVFLAIFVDGARVPVPANVGLAADAEAPLHVHVDEPAVVHVESLIPFWRATLGQFFDVWGVRLSPSCIGGYCADGMASLHVFVNGRRFAGGPRLVPLSDRESIVVVFGSTDEIPTPLPTFDWTRFD